MKLKYSLFVIAMCMFCGFASAGQGELVLEGVYKGKNLFVQNPFNGSQKDFCTQEVIVNNKVLLSEVKSSAFEIDLSSFTIDESLFVKIVYKEDCQPKVINPHAIGTKKLFSYNTLKIDYQAISWSTHGETDQTVYFLEKFVNNSWLVVSPPIKSLGDESSAHYMLKTSHHSGINKYRIKSFNEKGQVYYSKIYEYESREAPVTFKPKKVKDNILLSKATPYQVLDQFGNVLLKGEEANIDLKQLKAGTYYLNFDNKLEKFTKR
jgi:hypothetical protein